MLNKYELNNAAIQEKPVEGSDQSHIIPDQSLEQSLEKPENQQESVQEQVDFQQEKNIQQQSEGSLPVKSVKTKKLKQKIQQPITKSQELIEIEKILAEDLKDMYSELPPELQNRFKTEGEKTARTIELMLKKAKVNVKKIISLITGWLKIIPGINKFFLEQEAKIKADELISKFKQQ